MERCEWKFISPKKYKFKFVLLFKGQGYVNLTGNYGQEITLKEYEKPPIKKVIDSEFLIITSVATGDITVEPFFKGYLSVIKKHPYPKILEAGCSVITKNGTTTWFTDPKFAYPNNAQCWYNFTVPWQTQIVVSTGLVFIEKSADQILYYDDDGEHVLIEHSPGKPIYSLCNICR
uniref:CUB domain-containing protein n=1 Tax=Panagrolaimus sp. ES5 TaxID=591445 RepID=A0AC34GRM1_9BILA